MVLFAGVIYTSLMPKGVEQQSLMSGAKGAAKIYTSLMPKGVEQDSPTADTPRPSHLYFSDAERR